MDKDKLDLSFWVRAGLGFGMGVCPWVFLWGLLTVLFFKWYGAQVLWEIAHSPIK